MYPLARCWLVALTACAALHAFAEPAPKMARIGYLTPNAQPEREAVFRTELASLGWVTGRNLSIEYRNAEGNLDRLPALAAELARERPDVIVAFVTQASVAAKGATRTIPIVMIGVADPLGARLVASYARPGGNVTGNSLASVDVIGKQLQLLRELRPDIARVGVLANPSNAVFDKQQLEATRSLAGTLGVALVVAQASRPAELDAAFASLARGKAQAVLVFGDPMFSRHTERIAKLAIQHRLAAIGPFPNYADAGTLMAYGADFDEMFRGAARYVDRILKGANPGDLPVERASRFLLTVNLRTARALDVVLPPSILDFATRRID